MNIPKRSQPGDDSVPASDSSPLPHPDLLDRLQAIAPALHKAELLVAKAVLEDPESVGRLSIQALAERAGVSEPTIIRLVRKLGCSGYTDFKHRLNEHLVVARMFLRTETLVKNSKPESIVERMHEAATRTVTEMMQTLDRVALAQAVQSVVGARRILAMGVGGSSANIAIEAENRLFRLGIAISSTADPYKQRMASVILSPQDVVLAFSATGKPASILDSVRIARETGAKVISVAPAASPLARASDIVLAINVFTDEVYFNLPSPTRYAQLFVLDCIAASVAVELGSSAFQKLKSIRLTLSALHGAMKFQPMGD